MPHSDPDSHEMELAPKVAFLSRPGSYPEAATLVETIETHMSWVFLTERHAYKLKKPVCHDYLDFRTLAARHHYCNEELRLNRRLAKDVYLAVVPLCIDWQGKLHIDRWGRPVDWLVKMRRLAAQDMLDRAVRDLHAGARDIFRVAHCLAAFYRACPSAGLSASGYIASLERQIDCNLRDLCRPEYGLDSARVMRLCDAQRRMLHQRRELFAARVAANRIVEGHGDLRPEHVCIRPRVVVIDCLEFSRELRLVDPLDELAFLTLEMERMFANGFANMLLATYLKAANDQPPAELMQFYKSLRAAVRARLAIRHLDEEIFRRETQWPNRANAYLELARRYQDAISSTSDPPP